MAEAARIDKEDAEERQKKIEDAEQELKMTLRPRTRSVTSSSYKTTEDEDEDPESNSESNGYPPSSPPIPRQENDLRTDAEIANKSHRSTAPPAGTWSSHHPMTRNEIPKDNVIANDAIILRKVPLRVYNKKGKTVLSNNKGMDQQKYFKNLMVTMTRAEEGIKEDQELGKLDEDIPKVAQQRMYKAAKIAAEHTWKGQDSDCQTTSDRKTKKKGSGWLRKKERQRPTNIVVVRQQGKRKGTWTRLWKDR